MLRSQTSIPAKSRPAFPVAGVLGEAGPGPSVAAAVGHDDVPVVAERVRGDVGEEAAPPLDGLSKTGREEIRHVPTTQTLSLLCF